MTNFPGEGHLYIDKKNFKNIIFMFNVTGSQFWLRVDPKFSDILIRAFRPVVYCMNIVVYCLVRDIIKDMSLIF